MDPRAQLDMPDSDRSGERLRALLDRVGWSGAALAREVNQIGTESGLPLRYSRASVAQWLAGVRPRPPVPELIAEALSRKVGHPVTPAQIGYCDGHDGGWQSEADPVEQLVTLAGVQRRQVMRAAVYSLAALSFPRWVDAITAPVTVADDASTLRVGCGQVEAADAMLRKFSAVDAEYGARATRRATADYLATTISPWLRAPATDQTHRALVAVAAKLAYLCGFLCVDDELPGIAQRYYHTALRMSAEANDPAGYATTLRAMSVQAYTLGHYTHAFDLAESAQTTGAAVAPSSRAFLVGQLALAAAATGDRYRAIDHLRTAEHLLDRAGDDSAALGVHHQSSMAHQRAAVRACLGDRPGAITALRQSIRYRPATERRSRAITLASLADLQLRQGHLEDAVASSHRFLDDYPCLGSGRADSALATLRARVRPFASNPSAATVLRRATALHQMARWGSEHSDGATRVVNPLTTEPHSETGPASLTDAVADLHDAMAATERARERLVDALRAEHQTGTSANRLAAVAAGVMSRPVVLRALKGGDTPVSRS
ncbi:hypothetical protein [Actinocrispum wychmicini]|uniref:Tetratricopeptide repeat protein n=1 Tax=Actinocrispum wychmicini TaxID=1213861 RepID=A0A4R2IL89_9PSEU|nr:hypothetical protein [Actinocrispum wychmicini]TCO45901.1 hypothetical protein EV192_12087 [Actinocrispum wychmicini]